MGDAASKARRAASPITVAEFPAAQVRFGRGGAYDDRCDRSQRDAGVGHHRAVPGHDRGGADNADGLGAAQAQLDEAAGGVGGHLGHGDADQDLIVGQVDAAEAGDERASGMVRSPGPRGHGHRRVQRHERHDGVVGRAGGDDVARHSGAVANLRRAHLPAGPRQGKRMGHHRRTGHALVVGHQRAQVQVRRVLGDGGQAANPGQVDDAQRAAVGRGRTPRSISSSRSVPPAMMRAAAP
ncbi:MAG: hypothetical protein R2854_00940 [Caldilineaceae bacterium]